MNINNAQIHTVFFILSNKILTLVAQISEQIGRLTLQQEQEKLLRLRKVNRMAQFRAHWQLKVAP